MAGFDRSFIVSLPIIWLFFGVSKSVSSFSDLSFSLVHLIIRSVSIDMLFLNIASIFV